MKKKKISVLGILVITLVVGLVSVGCDTGSSDIKDALDGTTWEGPGFSWGSQSIQPDPNSIDFILTFNSPDWLIARSSDGRNQLKGTYSVSGSNITFTTTDEWWAGGDIGWHKINDESYFPLTGTFTSTTVTIVMNKFSPLSYTKQ